MKKFLRSGRFTAVLFVLAVALILVGSIGGTRAAISSESDVYESQLEVPDIAIALVENGKTPETSGNKGAGGLWSTNYSDLGKNLLKDSGDSQIKLGKSYPLDVAVKNTGAIDAFVRVTIYRYWVDSNGKKLDSGWFNGSGSKRLDLDPSLIEVEIADPGVWKVDNAPSEGDERIVLYYTGNGGILAVGEQKSFIKSVSVSADVAKLVTKTTSTKNGLTTTTYTYAYDGVGFVLDVQVDAVQTHNADPARISAWGKPGAQ